VSATVDASTFAALGEPNRLRIVELLRGGPRAVGEIAEQLGLRQPQVSKHLRVLGQAELVTAEVRHRHRIYRLQRQRFADVAAWVGSFESLWEARLDSLDRFLQSYGPEEDRP
jgi:DNA-binding transcriptional ArsR family regulator